MRVAAGAMLMSRIVSVVVSMRMRIIVVMRMIVGVAMIVGVMMIVVVAKMVSMPLGAHSLPEHSATDDGDRQS